jgi:ribonuclease Z
VVSGDTRKTKSVVAAAKGADLLAHEALSPELVKHLEKGAKATGRDGLAHIMNDILNYHTSPEEAAEQARDAGVGYLLLYHIVPALPISALEGPFLGRSREIYSGPIRVGHDGDFIILPVNSKNVLLTHRL